MTDNAATDKRPGLRGALVAIAIGLVLTVAIAEVALRLIMPNWREFYSGHFMEATFVPGYGRVHIGRPGFDGHFSQNNGDFRAHIKINQHGLRNTAPVQQADGRIWVIGDSMAFGWGVERAEAYSAVMQKESGRPTYSVASPGTDVCGYQALVARMPQKLKPKAVVVGLIVENDVHDYNCARGTGPKTAPPEAKSESWAPTKIQIKYFLTGSSSLYNFMATSVKRVAILNELFAALGLVERPHAYREAFDLTNADKRAESTAAELAHLRSMFPPDTPFLVLICPARFDVRDNDSFFVGLRTKVVAALNRRGIDVMDASASLKTQSFESTHFVHDGHWSALGHRLVGLQLARWAQETVN